MRCYISLCSDPTNTVLPIKTAEWDSAEGMWYVDINTMDELKYLIENVSYSKKTKFVYNLFPSLIFTEINGVMRIEVYDDYIE